MKTGIHIIILALSQLFFSSCKQSVEYKTDENIDECKKGILKAERDAKNGQYEILSFGLPDYPDWNFQMFYEDFVKKNYGIQIGNGGCIVYEEKECYSDKMKEIVLEKYGDNLFESARKKARIEYKKYVQSQIDDNYLFSGIDTLPKFVNNNVTINSYLKSRLNNENGLNGRILAVFTVEKDGDLSDIEIKHGKNKELDREIIKVLNEMPNWNSGIYFGQKVRTRVGLPISFGEKN